MTDLEPRPSRVLVVDDDPVLSEVVGRHLEREGLAVTFAADGEEGLALALSSPPDLVVLDVMLPGIDELEVCRQIRESAPIPVVTVTEADTVPIAKGLVGAHQGSIEVMNRTRGCCFTVRLGSAE